jgi:hypothetical protein
LFCACSRQILGIVQREPEVEGGRKSIVAAQNSLSSSPMREVIQQTVARVALVHLVQTPAESQRQVTRVVGDSSSLAQCLVSPIALMAVLAV